MDDARLTSHEREILRDVEAYTWGSLDVSWEDVRARLHELTPEEWNRIEAVMMRRAGESMARQRAAEREVEALERAREDLRRLIERLEP
jgi:sugar phosphate isomerase/epimerase